MYYFVTLLFVLLSSKATLFDLSNICWFLIDLVILWVGFEKKRFSKSDLNLFFKFSLIYIGFCTVRSLFLTDLPFSYWVSDIVFLFKYVLTSFLFCALLKEKAIYYLIKVVFHLTVISIPLFCFQLVAGDLIYGFGKLINLPHAHFNGYVNFLIFTYIQQHPFQNSGFSWEPGAFGFFLNLTLLLNFLTNDFTFDKKAKWFVVAIITTLSTTTYIGFMFILLLYFRARGVAYLRLLFFIVPILLVFAAVIPFLSDKIVFTYDKDMQDMKNIQTLSDYYIQRGQEMPLNRFASLLYLIKLFGIQLIWGVSNIYEKTVPILKNINISNGIFAFFAQFGLIGLGFLVQRCYIFFKKFTENVELSVYCVLVILIFGFSECIFVTSLVLCFLFLYYYAEPDASLSEYPEDPVLNSANATEPAF